MRLCNEKYKDVFSLLKFSEGQERTEYVLKYLYHRSQMVGSKTFVCTKKDILEYYHSVISDSSLSRKLRTLENNGYIECMNATDQNGATCGINCKIKI